MHFVLSLAIALLRHASNLIFCTPGVSIEMFMIFRTMHASISASRSSISEGQIRGGSISDGELVRLTPRGTRVVEEGEILLPPHQQQKGESKLELSRGLQERKNAQLKTRTSRVLGAPTGMSVMMSAENGHPAVIRRTPPRGLQNVEGNRFGGNGVSSSSDNARGTSASGNDSGYTQESLAMLTSGHPSIEKERSRARAARRSRAGAPTTARLPTAACAAADAAAVAGGPEEGDFRHGIHGDFGGETGGGCRQYFRRGFEHEMEDRLLRRGVQRRDFEGGRKVEMLKECGDGGDTSSIGGSEDSSGTCASHESGQVGNWGGIGVRSNTQEGVGGYGRKGGKGIKAGVAAEDIQRAIRRGRRRSRSGTSPAISHMLMSDGDRNTATSSGVEDGEVAFTHGGFEDVGISSSISISSNGNNDDDDDGDDDGMVEQELTTSKGQKLERTAGEERQATSRDNGTGTAVVEEGARSIPSSRTLVPRRVCASAGGSRTHSSNNR